MLELLVSMGATELGKLVFEQILNLGQEAAKDYVKDFFKESLKDGIAAAKPEVTKKAVAEALKEFLLLIQDELEDNLSKSQIRCDYEQQLSQFIKDKSVKPILGKAFENNCKSINVRELERIWEHSRFKNEPFPSMPNGFDWQRIDSEYMKKVRRIVRASSELKSLLETQLLEEIKINTEQLAENTATISPGFDIDKYRESLQCSYGYLKLHTLEYIDQQRPIKLWKLFIEQTVREALPPLQYELPNDVKDKLIREKKLEKDLSSQELEQYQCQYFQLPSPKVLEALTDCKRAMILGDPGAGKSTLLQYLALEWVEGKTEELPLLIELREYAISNVEDFLDFLHRGAGADWQLDKKQLEKYLESNSTLVMFDGLDEVFDRNAQGTIVDSIIRFAQKYRNARVLISSRIIGYNPDRLKHSNFRHFTIQPLDRGEIHEFIDHWYTQALDNDTDKPRLVKRLKKAIANSKAIQNLADNPLLLTMMAILNRQQDLPRDRAELYDQASRVLLHNWDVDHKRLQLPEDSIGRREKQEILRLVAYKMQAGAEKNSRGNIISAENLTKILVKYLQDQGFHQPREKANLIIQQLRERNFILCYRGADHYSFVHRTFLEYFCAEEIKYQFNKRGTIGGLTFDQLRNEIFEQYWSDETWHEVLRLICGMIDETFSGELINYLVDKDPQNTGIFDFSNLLLASDCFSEVKNQNSIRDTSNKLLSNLKALFNNDQVSRRDSKLYQITLGQAAISIVRNWPDDIEILRILKSLVKDNGDNLAFRVLAEISEEKPEALSILRDFIAPICPVNSKEGSTFSTLRTKLTDGEVIKKALDTLGIDVKTEADVRNGNLAKVKADIVGVLVGHYDIGYLLNSDGSYDLMANLGGIANTYNHIHLIHIINAVYGFFKTKKDLETI